MLEDIVTKILLGISLAAPIGPVNAEMIKRGLATGFWGSFNVRLGGATSNLIMLLLAYFGLGSIIQYPKIILSISVVGVIALMYLGMKNIIKALDHKSLKIFDTHYHKPKYSLKNGLFVGFSLSFASPIGLMFWLSTFATSMQQHPSTKFNINDLLINLFIIVGVLLWGAFVSTILHFFKKFINEKKLRLVTAISGLILIYFSIKYAGISLIKFKATLQ